MFSDDSESEQLKGIIVVFGAVILAIVLITLSFSLNTSISLLILEGIKYSIIGSVFFFIYHAIKKIYVPITEKNLDIYVAILLLIIFIFVVVKLSGFGLTSNLTSLVIPNSAG